MKSWLVLGRRRESGLKSIQKRPENCFWKEAGRTKDFEEESMWLGSGAVGLRPRDGALARDVRVDGSRSGGPAHYQKAGADGLLMLSQEIDWTYQGAC